MNKKILVIEDESYINDILTTALKSEGYLVRSAFNGTEARELLNNFNPNLTLLDVNLPDESGFDLCKFINSTYSIPIIMLTARNDVFDKVLGLELGADDYITKPFHIKEVLTRIKIALRRIDKYANNSKSTFIPLNSIIKINYESRLVYKKDTEVILKPKEYELLEFLSQNKNRVFSRDEILNNVWEFSYEGDSRTIDIHIRRLRSKLDIDGLKSIIETVFGIGYVMR
ncbi:response regulator transcription factor [Clostridium gasigenes]|uniref:Stage 0 sporulation protein A homolog n=1 Tax=Clostridium gasigenes TaxID=94869 RepID=A0A7X0S9P4_9CLOT|nr:response regulator transcription factor [Clostridium gasigenes]MBB6713560.1 response regulator transcription factor [Clostridium gasigenes]MBU3108848.1 response regulator transcription factor [Clostridium gasigenes]